MADPDASPKARPAIYFFLSYAHSLVSGERIGTDTDPSVGKFFRDLRARVTRQASPRTEMQMAFFDQDIPVVADLRTELSEALGRTEVFVPLYSPGYFANSWPLREQEVFRRRLRNRPGIDPGRRIVPVLWTPFPSWDPRSTEERDALRLAPDVPGYSENGVRALCMLSTYRPAYDQVLDRLAQRVVSVVERSPIGPSPAPGLDEVTGPDLAGAAFAVAILAPRNRLGPLLPMGVEQEWQRPFADRRAPAVAQYIATAAERLGFQTQVLDSGQATELARSPAIVIVDPWVLADDDGEDRLGRTFARLPEWVMPLVVTDATGTSSVDSGQRLKAETLTVLHNAGRSRVDHAETMAQFRDAVPRVVSRARRTYLRHAPVFPPSEEGFSRPAARRRFGAEVPDL